MELFLFMTLSASLLIVFALILRPLIGRFLPRTVQMLLWSLAALRLLIPVRIPAPFSLFSLLKLNKAVQPTPPAPSSPILFFPTDSMASTEMAAPSVTAPTPLPQDAPIITRAELLPFIWIIGAALLAAVLLILHGRELHRCRFKIRDRESEQLVPGYIRVYRCEAISAPFVTGVLRPQIILPVDLPTEALSPVLAHEVSHIRGLDVLKKYLFAAALCVNWFNPLVWLMTHLAAQDMEILCDTRALRGPLAPSAGAYARALLHAQERHSLLTSGFKSHAETRILNILKAEKTNLFTSVLSVVLALALVFVCITQPVAAATLETSEQVEKNTDASDPHLAYFVQNDRFRLDTFYLGARWDNIRTQIVEKGIDTDPTLEPGFLSSNLNYTVIPMSLFGYSGTATLYFHLNTLTEITCDFPFGEEASALTAYRDILSQASYLFGNAQSKPNSTVEKAVYWQKNDTRFSLGIVTSVNPVYAVRLQLNGSPPAGTRDFTAYMPHEYGIDNAELEVLMNYLNSGSADFLEQQEVLDMCLDINNLRTTLNSTKYRLSMLEREYAETILADATDEYRAAVRRLLFQGDSFAAALHTAGREEGLRVIEEIRSQLPDLSGTGHRRLSVYSADGLLVAEVDLPNGIYYELYRDIKSAFGFYEINCTFTYITP